MSKTEMRRRFRELREAIDPAKRQSIDAAIAAQVEALPEFASVQGVFTYLSVGAEVDTRAIIRAAWQAGKLVAVPRCVPGTNLMRWHRLDSFEGLESGSFGIEEPPDDEATLVDPASWPVGRAIAIVPGYSFDERGYRLGYGGGFYDVFLPAFKGVAVGLCRACQFSEEPLPCDAHDIPVGIVVTENGVKRQ